MKKTLLREIFRNESRPRKPNGQLQWAILVVDETSMKILQSCMQTHELTAENIASFEMIESKVRIPTNMHAIYFLTPVSTKNHFQIIFFNIKTNIIVVNFLLQRDKIWINYLIFINQENDSLEKLFLMVHNQK